MFNSKLFFAVYWSRAKQWTLLAVQDLEADVGSLSITMLQALQRSRMHLLGDRMIGTLPLLRLRLIGAVDSGYASGEDGQYLFSIASAELYCGAALITDPVEQQIAWFLMNNCLWDVSDTPAEFDGPRLAAMTFVITPPERANPNQEFEIVGRLSELVSRQFDACTTRDGESTGISPQAEPEAFGVAIPNDFKGNALRLWRFDLRPPRPKTCAADHGTRNQ
jgi:hypothetical protein